jgi:hypothetical protein
MRWQGICSASAVDRDDLHSMLLQTPRLLRCKSVLQVHLILADCLRHIASLGRRQSLGHSLVVNTAVLVCVA